MQAVARGRREVKAARERGGFLRQSQRSRFPPYRAARARAPSKRPALANDLVSFDRSSLSHAPRRARVDRTPRDRLDRARVARRPSFPSPRPNATRAKRWSTTRRAHASRSDRARASHSPDSARRRTLDAFATTCADARARIGWTDKITNHRRGWVVILSEMSECTYITTFTSMCVYL